MWETWVRSLGWEDPLEKEMATHSSTLAWKIPWMEEPGRLQSMGSQRVGGHDWATSLSLFLISAETEAPVLWPLDVNSWLTGKDPDAAKDWGQEEKGRTEDEMVGWHHRLNRHESEQTPGDSEGQGSLASCSLWGSKESDTAEQLNWTEWIILGFFWLHWVFFAARGLCCSWLMES